ncbi:carboxymuconolactone decarboxylase family protein [Nonomuraea sp. NPDC000554]|uniref:carboxymuconolactone decarboxylase family protein n=1 Tax=Nonomuraea sp. NPDC000554 TaxID=3154259 RepID=UPI003321F0D1
MSIPTTTEQDDLRSRLPDPAQFFPELAQIAGAMSKATRNGSIPQTTISLVQLRAGQIVGSTYHTVRQTGLLRKAGETEERITAVASWQDAPYFTGAERVALELVEAARGQADRGRAAISGSPRSCAAGAGLRSASRFPGRRRP